MKSAFGVTPALLVSTVTFLSTAITVAPNGSDNAAGTLAAPWASIAHDGRLNGGGNLVLQTGGGLPVLPNLRLAANSALINKGVDVGLPYSGQAPALGAFQVS